LGCLFLLGVLGIVLNIGSRVWGEGFKKKKNKKKKNPPKKKKKKKKKKNLEADRKKTYRCV